MLGYFVTYHIVAEDEIEVPLLCPYSIVAFHHDTSHKLWK